MPTEITTTESDINHPLEDALDLEEGTTKTLSTHRETELVPVQEYDKKDSELETQFQEVYDAAMDAFDNSFGNTTEVESKYKARNGEVAVQFLTAALQAANAKANLKTHKDKLAAKAATTAPKTINNNLVVDRNFLLRQLREQEEEKEEKEIN